MCPTGYVAVFALYSTPSSSNVLLYNDKKYRMKLRQADKYNINLLPLDVSVLYDLCAVFSSRSSVVHSTYNWVGTIRVSLLFRVCVFVCYLCMCTLALLFDAVILERE